MRLIPFPVHGVLETAVAIGLVAAPWLLGFAIDLPARNFYVGAGVVVLLVVALTDYRAAATLPVTAARSST